MKQRRLGVKLDYVAMRQRCEEIAAFIDDVLKSRVWNAMMGNFATLACGKCDHPIRKRIPHGQTDVKAACHECGAGYTIIDTDNGQVRWQPDEVELQCANRECGTKIYPFRSEVELGVGWTCDECGGRNELRLGVVHLGVEGRSPVASEEPADG
jgi:hypothetical protein